MYQPILVATSLLAFGAAFNKQHIESESHHQYTVDLSSDVWPWRSFKTSPHTPPELNVSHYGGKKLADGYMFVSPTDSKNNDGLYELSGTGFVFDMRGDLVYAAEETGMDFCNAWIGGMTDFRAQDYNDHSYITYWNGCNRKGEHWGHRWGRVTFIDEEYKNFTINPDLNINTLDPETRGQIDVHDHQMTDRNTMLVTSYNNTKYDLRELGGPEESWVADGTFFEIDIETQKVLFEWRAIDHVNLRASRFGFNGPGGHSERVPWDHLHINSVQAVGKNYLISARHHWSVYLISGEDGHILWRLDGINGGDFGGIPETFRWQHHARAHNVTDHGMTVTLFNNMVNGPKTLKTQTQALAFWLPLNADHTPRHRGHREREPVLVKRLQTNSQPLYTATQGSYQFDLGNGNGFVGYGTEPVAREYGPRGDLRWQAWFGFRGKVQSYRVFKQKWHGTPKDWNPVVVFEDSHYRAQAQIPRVYVSWNGATDISGWAVSAGKNPNRLEEVGVAEKHGFETVFDLQGANCVQVAAIRRGETIRNSNVACLDDDEAKLPDTVEEVDDSNDQVGGEGLGQDDIEMENKQLQAENEALQAELNELEEETWAAYRLFAEVALAVVLIVAGVWGFIVIRDWRRRRQYASFESIHTSGGFGGSLFALPGWLRGGGRHGGVDYAAEATEYDEAKLDESPLHDVYTKDKNRGGLKVPMDDDSDDDDNAVITSNRSRTPFLRQTSNMGV